MSPLGCDLKSRSGMVLILILRSPCRASSATPDGRGSLLYPSRRGGFLTLTTSSSRADSSSFTPAWPWPLCRHLHTSLFREHQASTADMFRTANTAYDTTSKQFRDVHR